MEVSDVQKLFGYIRTLHPHCPEDKLPRLTRKVADLWIRALDRYPLEQVYKAAEEHARSCRYWPELSEIVSRCESAAPCGRLDDGQKKHLRWVRAYQQALREQLAKLALLPFAGATGKEYQSWRAQCVAAGMDFASILHRTQQNMNEFFDATHAKLEAGQKERLDRYVEALKGAVADSVDSEKSVGSNLEHTYAIYTGKEIFRRTRE